VARIRTIKPEFWTDEKIVSLPFEARLFFVGLWNFCDDDGYIEDNAVRLKLQIFPADQLDVDKLIDILCMEELLVRGESGDSDVILIPHFVEHQKVSHPSKSLWMESFRRKKAIPRDVRRKVAEKYKCPPNGAVDAYCNSCGLRGEVFWTNSWIGFSKLELSAFVPEDSGGNGGDENIVLCCRNCNRTTRATEVLSDSSNKTPEDSRGLRPELNGIELNGKDERSAAIASMPVLAEAASIAVDPMPASQKISAGAFAALKEKHLSDTRLLSEWFQRQLSLPDPVCGHTRADLLLVIAAGLHAMKVPEADVKKTRVAIFVNVVHRGRWRQVTKYVSEANDRLIEFETKLRGPNGKEV
jgi:hypothetical protein